MISFDEIYEELSQLQERIVRVGSKWQVQSEKGKNMGTYDTKEEAEKRLKQIEYFKHLNEDVDFSEKDFNIDSFKELNFPKSLLSKPYKFYGIIDNDKNIGNLVLNLTNNQVEIVAIEIIEKNKNYGSTVIDKLKELYPNKDIYVESVPEAKRFYEKNGFEVTGFDKEYGNYKMLFKTNNLI